MKLAIVSILSFYAVAVRSQCWWSGCQPKTWAERGCFPSTDWHQTDSKPCDNGDIFNCCPGGTLSPPVQTEEKGLCSWYGAEGEIPPGFVLPSGEVFDRFAMRAAHKSLPFGTRIRVTNLNNGRSVNVIINDRGPFVPGRIVDLTYAAFGEIGNRDEGVVPCSYFTL